MLLTISPAKRLNLREYNGELQLSEPFFIEKAQILNQHIRQLDAIMLQALHGINEVLAYENNKRNLNWGSSNYAKYAAVLCFDGEVYRGLASTSWSADTFEYAQSHLVILSGLYGFLKPMDAIWPYRLEMSTKLPDEIKKSLKIKNLKDFWQEDAKRFFATFNNTDGLLINLASKEYGEAIPKDLFDHVHEVDFFEVFPGKKPKKIQVYLKQARGQFARYVLENKIEFLKDTLSFQSSGYFYARELSNSHKSVFLRNHPINGSIEN